MNRREALAKATITTAGAAAGLLPAEPARAFIRALKETDNWSTAIRHETRNADSGTIDKLSTGARIIRAATENADDGYRAGATFGTTGYTTVKVRLPWEVTEDVFHGNIEQEALEGILADEMTTQFGNDLSDLDVNGDTAAGAGADQAFLQIDDGIVKLLAGQAATYPARNINGATINAGVLAKDHFFEALYAMPNKYKQQGTLEWIMSPNRATSWWEKLTDRAGAAGDALLTGSAPSGSQTSPGTSAARGPLGIPIREVTFWPDNLIVLTNPKNFVRVTSWEVRRRRVTGETDAELAAKDKRFYVFFVKRDVIVEEYDAAVRVYGLTAP
jgi:hypothetical protein